jgi:hypothetical protein
MANAAVSDDLDTDDAHVIAGAKAADLIWRDHPDARTISDPRIPTFADAVIDGLACALTTMPGAIGQVVSGAASAAEDLNVEPFQGLVEIIQNADDLGATEVRFALREVGGRSAPIPSLGRYSARTSLFHQTSNGRTRQNPTLRQSRLRYPRSQRRPGFSSPSKPAYQPA